MSDPLNPDLTFKPRAERESETKTGFDEYAKKLAIGAAITKAAALAGGFVGGKMGGPAGAVHGYSLGGSAAGAYEAYKVWEPIKGTQKRIEELLPIMSEELNPANLQQEALAMQQLQNDFAENKRLFTEMVGRRTPATIQPRGKAFDALTKEKSSNKEAGGRE